MGFWAGIKKFSKEFVNIDNTSVHTPYAAILLSLSLATPIVALSCSIIITHIFVRGHVLDAPTVDLLKYLLGSVTGIVAGAGATVFAKNTIIGNMINPQIGSSSITRGPKPELPVGEKD